MEHRFRLIIVRLTTESLFLEQIGQQAKAMPSRVFIAPICVAVLLFTIWVAVLALPGAWLACVILFVSFPIVAIPPAILLPFALVVLFWRRHRISGVTMLGGIMTVIIMAGVPTPVESLSGKVVDLLHLMNYRGVLDKDSQEIQRQGISPAIAVVDIDGFGSMTSGIALDPTGEILLPPSKRSKGWLATAGQTELGADSLEARHIAGNYYAWFHY